jgi:hypothetical protein
LLPDEVWLDLGVGIGQGGDVRRAVDVVNRRLVIFWIAAVWSVIGKRKVVLSSTCMVC